jgi:hypothetical protein
MHACDPPGNFSLISQAPSHPIHYLQRDDSIERKFSTYFRKAFGEDLIVHRNAGGNVPLYCGKRPEPKAGEDRVSIGYIKQLETLPLLHEQGDGMKGFVGVLLHTVVVPHTITLVDEPEAFLHPPQARLLGCLLAKEVSLSNRQFFFATHSGDFLRGLLDAGLPSVRVLRITRDGNKNIVRELKATEVATLWKDPLLRHSNILDGLFHQKAVACESDSDCRFYAAMMDALSDGKTDAVRTDIMFTHCGGKHRLPTVIQSLQRIGVPIAAVSDFDVLSAEQPLRDIYEALGGVWKDIEVDWRNVKSAIDGKKPELNTEEIRKDIQKELDAVKEPLLPKQVTQNIEKILHRSTPWAMAKQTGKAFVPPGQVTQSCERLLQRLRQAGLFVVDKGELESFARSIGGHGPAWVNGVVTKDLVNDPELEDARRFVAAIVG